jgi:hypothetical protein
MVEKEKELDFDLDFEVDFCTCLNMRLGMSYDKAVEQATKEVKEAHRPLVPETICE